jgi:hypothetical protein
MRAFSLLGFSAALFCLQQAGAQARLIDNHTFIAYGTNNYQAALETAPPRAQYICCLNEHL